MGQHLQEGDMSARTSDVLPACSRASNKASATWGGGPCAFADDEDANRVAGNFVLAQKVGNEGGAVEMKNTLAFPDDFVGRLRQVQLPPRLAFNNLGRSEAVVV
jgi:hypothetical protein